MLVIDDLHLADDEAVLASLSVFLQHLPSLLHVIVSSRRVPALPLDRLRARGQLGDVHFAELAFSPEEATAMLASLSPSLSADDVDDIATQAERLGRRAATRRARASGRPGLDPDNSRAPSAERILIGDYITREVLAKEDPVLVGALFDVAVVERVNDALACVLCERDDAGDLLAQAEARGLFVNRLGPDGWYEVHSIVRSVLLAEQARRDPDRLRAGRIRAARWLEEVGDVVAALEQWQAAGEHHEALRLLSASHVQLYDTGRESTIRAVLAATPADARAADLESLVAVGWCSLLVSRPQFLDAVEQATWWASRNGSAGGRLGARLAVAQGHRRDHHRGLGQRRHARQAGGASSSVTSGRTTRSVGPGGTSWPARSPCRSVGTTTPTRSARCRSSCAAIPTASWRSRRPGRSDTRWRDARSTRSASPPASGRRRRVAAWGCRSPSWRSPRPSPSASSARRPGPACELEGLLDLDVEPMTYVRALARLELVQSYLDGGDAPGRRGGVRAGTRADRGRAPRPRRPGVAGHGAARCWRSRPVTWMRREAWSAQDDDPFWGPVGAARVHLAGGRPRDAATAIADVVPRGPRHEVVLALVRARATSDHEIADKWATRAIEHATVDGSPADGRRRRTRRRSISSSGRHGWRRRAGWIACGGWRPSARRATDCRSPAQVEALTERERDVLRFLPSRLTIAEIADELYVSVNTLKFHLKIIYRKLGVGSRAEASEVARATASVHRAP